jgi:hypothetical protein
MSRQVSRLMMSRLISRTMSRLPRLAGLTAVILLAVALCGPPANAADGRLLGIEVQLDNDQFAFTPGSQERWYTSGVLARWALDADPTDFDARLSAAWCANVIGCDAGARTARVWSIGQAMYTPAYLSTTSPQPYDWPYAAALSATISSVVYGERTRQSLGVSLGVIGPAALGEPVQNAVHRVINNPPPLGWGLQVRAQPVFELNWSGMVATPISPGRFDLVGRALVQLGNPVTQAGVGGLVRVGALPMGPEWPGEMALSRRPQGLHVYAGAEVRGVARNILIDGATYGYDSLVQHRPWVAEAIGGASWAFDKAWSVDYSLSFRTVEFTAPLEPRALNPQRIGMIRLRWTPQ